jgi:predicted alpha/beta hydrolase
VKSVLTAIIALLVKGKPIKKKKDSGFPKDFFEVLVREDWRKWVEAVKRELEAWNDNNAVEEVDIMSVPVTAKLYRLGSYTR